MTAKLQELLENLQTLSRNRLPPFLFPDSLLTQTLANVSQALLDSRSKYSLIYSQPAFYYNHAKIIHFPSNFDIYITIHFPLTFATKRLFTLYKVRTTALVTHDDNSFHIVALDNPPAAFAIDDSRTRYL